MREADVGPQSADTIKLNFRFRNCPKGRGLYAANLGIPPLVMVLS
jgi:hypothetical protein